MGVNVQEHKGTYRYLTVGLLILLFSSSMAVTAFGGQFEDADAAYNRGDYGTAYRLYKPLAEQGNVKAQHQIGVLHKFGWGVQHDWAETRKWFRKAADQGDNYSMFYLGVMYQDGEGVPQDYAEAAKWYRKAADQGDDGSQYLLGEMYFKGQGVPQNYVLAHMWINLSISKLGFGQTYRGLHFSTRDWRIKKRDEVASLMTPGQIAEAQRLAREWKPKVEGK